MISVLLFKKTGLGLAVPDGVLLVFEAFDDCDEVVIGDTGVEVDDDTGTLSEFQD